MESGFQLDSIKDALWHKAKTSPNIFCLHTRKQSTLILRKNILDENIFYNIYLNLKLLIKEYFPRTGDFAFRVEASKGFHSAAIERLIDLRNDQPAT